MAAFVHVTAWEKVSLLRRVLCAFARVAILFIFLATLGFGAFAYRYPIAASVWHWTHGYSTNMGGYVVPVPQHWFIMNHNSDSLHLVNTAPKRPSNDGKLHMAASISVFPFRRSSFDANKVELWLTLRRQQLSDEGVENIEEKRLQFGDETASCIGGSELSAALRALRTVNTNEKLYPARAALTNIFSVECMSDRGLNVWFVGEPHDREHFYEFVSQIRRHE